jgi:MFS transporter, DHA1 family, tetracycline resistance protein
VPESPTASRHALSFILITVALDALGLGLLAPVIPRLILQLTGEGLARAAEYGGWLTATFAAVQFVAGPILGSLSDRYGRRPVLLISLAAFGASYVLMAVAPTLAWLFVAQVLTGTFGATPATAGALVADLTPPTERARHFGSLAAAFGIGLIVGPALGGMLIAYGERVPFIASAGLSLITLIYGLRVLPESLRPELRRDLSWHRLHPIGLFRELGRIQGVGVLLGALLLQRVASSTLPATWPYFTMQQYGWSARAVGYSLAQFGVAAVVSQIWLLRRVERRLGARHAAALGLVLLAIACIGLASGIGPRLAVASIPLATMGFMAGPALASVLSVSVGADQQGAVQGAVASLQGVAAVITPLLMPWLFSRYSAGTSGIQLPGAPYLLAAALAMMAVILIARAAPRGER